ncbi:hypothetical protein OO184_10885 [Photorhabdus sp. APURE]|uniref:hypothetical protein n=1 Tax=Photorhabdus aballayi TaxID=2991723 RepID=UPI00223DEDC8|nr:hypothetical protein [Photorhabdus aballayi]MCW7548433.1 hypothetical protein [Photorhabdus aballayi]
MNITQDMIEFAKTLGIKIFILPGEFQQTNGWSQEVYFYPLTNEGVKSPALFKMTNYENVKSLNITHFRNDMVMLRQIVLDEIECKTLNKILHDENDFKDMIIELNQIINQPKIKAKIDKMIDLCNY